MLKYEKGVEAMYESIIVEKEGAVGIISLNRPKKLNSLNLKVFQEMSDALKECTQDNDLKVLILSGSEKVFGAGADLKMISEEAPTSLKAHYFFSRQALPIYHQLAEFPGPTIAAISGLALGGVFELALACDLRIASETATFGLPEINLGLIPGGGGTQRLPRLVGMTKAKELLFTGDTFDAQEAYRIGLVNKVVAPDRLMEEAKYMANRLAQKPAFALQLLKKAVNQGMELPLPLALELEGRCFELLFSTEDAKEGIRAFMEKRKPNFPGN
ncbi:enoyl-CoA hydratase/isomerase family protein [Calderihabitans maritimus]|uniref:short-chain-enoyl-CoA hydratase n=1 Tax=Calderihabitans maritimus TaxID=1246530 RepID=A0A1Z5HSX0_9FIRM|nr:enoyl-CoA hydratase/isomerase family protein [Calderihabitans maritimus]GAW92629.1 enoyl-CoA hydratase/carnithine racemase [Calderihabitans maritimus]